MKIYLPVDSLQGFGGGFTFRRNLEKGLKMLSHSLVEFPREADISLVAGVTMVTKETIQKLIDGKHKFVVRLDNVPKNSRNRNSGTSRLLSFSQKANAIVYQSNWAKRYLQDFIKKDGEVIYNGTDQDMFTPKGGALDFHNKSEDTYLYSRFSRDETKQWERSWYDYQMTQMNNPYAKLVIVGSFSEELVQYNFDFFRGERIEYLGVIRDELQMARIMRGCKKFMATYYNDAFSNTYIEALCCGMQLVNIDQSGGTPEMLETWKEKGMEYFSVKRMAEEYVALFEKVLND